jgi:hypothetical protein
MKNLAYSTSYELILIMTITFKSPIGFIEEDAMP